ncbi:MAG: ABC transporter substrate-binding protein [Spirochaetales bacterium]|nr:ABC transporter substrate-binding protein [Spirochaetales bacterium]
MKILVPKSTSSVPLFLLAADDPVPGIDIEIEIFAAHPQALARLLTGEADLLFTGTSQGWENYLDGSPLVMINTGCWGVSFVMGNDPALTSFSALRGKHIALPFPGAPLDFQTRYILMQSGIDPDTDLSISYFAPAQAMAMLMKGQLDAAPLPEPLASFLAGEKGFYRLIDYQRVWAEVSSGDPRSPQVSLFATAGFAGANRDLIGKLVDGWEDAMQRVVDDPEEAARQFAASLGFSEDVVTEAIRNTLFYLPSSAENMQRVFSYYDRVKDFLPGDREDLSGDFFFTY